MTRAVQFQNAIILEKVLWYSQILKHSNKIYKFEFKFFFIIFNKIPDSGFHNCLNKKNLNESK